MSTPRGVVRVVVGMLNVPCVPLFGMTCDGPSVTFDFNLPNSPYFCDNLIEAHKLKEENAPLHTNNLYGKIKIIHESLIIPIN